MVQLHIGIIGDYNKDILAHEAIPLAIEIAAKQKKADIKCSWIATRDVTMNKLKALHGLWCAPGSPYQNDTGALTAIQFAREENRPFIGTCAGYQHAALEFARNVLGYKDADNAEVNPQTDMPLISPLSCSLIEKSEDIILTKGSKTQQFYDKETAHEGYHCSYGVNVDYLSIYHASHMNFVAHDVNGDPRALEINTHPFFVGTAYQPERTAIDAQTHPLITAYIRTIHRLSQSEAA